MALAAATVEAAEKRHRSEREREGGKEGGREREREREIERERESQLVISCAMVLPTQPCLFSVYWAQHP